MRYLTLRVLININLRLLMSISILIFFYLAAITSATPLSSDLLNKEIENTLTKKSIYHNKSIDLLQNNEFDQVIRLENQILQTNPNDLEAYLILTLAYLGKEDEKKALDQANCVDKIDPHFKAEIYISMGRFYAAKKRYYKALIFFHEALKIKDDPNVIDQVASIYLNQGRVKEARIYYEKILNSKPDYINLSRLYLKESDYQKAIYYAKKALQQDEKAVSAYVILGSSYLLTDQLDFSKSNFLIVKNLQPKFFLAHYYLGLIYLIQKKYDDALQAFNNVLMISPKVKEALLNIAVILHLKGDLEKAKEKALKAIDSDPTDSLGYLALGNIYLSEKNYEKADQVYQKASSLFIDFELSQFKTKSYFTSDISIMPAYFTLSNIYLREGLFQRSIEIVDKALSIHSSENLFFPLIKARAEAKLGNIKKAHALYASVINSNPKIITPYVDLGDLAAYKEKNINEAITLYQQAVKFAPEIAKLHLGLGDFYNKLGLTEKAINKYKTAISLSPKSVIGYNQLSWTLAEREKKFDEALSYALKGYTVNSNDSSMKDTLGWIYYLMGKYNDSLKIYSGFVQSELNNPTIYYHLGLVYQKLNRNNKAVESFEKALNISDEFPEAKKAIQSEEDKGMTAEIPINN